MTTYIETATQRYPVALDEIRSASSVLFGELPPSEVLDQLGMALVQPTEPPTYDTSVFQLEQAAPVLVDGQYRQAWRLQRVQQVVPLSVTSTQGKLALLDAGLYEAVIQAVAASDIRVGIWFNTHTWERDNPNVAAIGSQLRLTDAQIDALFVAANKIAK